MCSAHKELPGQFTDSYNIWQYTDGLGETHCYRLRIIQLARGTPRYVHS